MHEIWLLNKLRHNVIKTLESVVVVSVHGCYGNLIAAS